MEHDVEFLLTREAAALAREKEQTFRKRRWRGDGPRYLRLGNKILYERTDVLAWLRARKVASTSERSAA